MGSNAYHVVADGFSRISISSFDPEKLKVSPEVSARLDTFVEEQTRKAAARGGTFFDGSFVGVKMDSLRTGDDAITLDLQAISYSQHRGLLCTDPAAPVQAAYVNGIVITADDKLVFGNAQVALADDLGKLSIPAGGLDFGPDGVPSFGAQFLREASEEIGLTLDYHVREGWPIPGWINGMSSREGNYHLTCSFITPLALNAREMGEWFNDWKSAQDKVLASIRARGGTAPETEFGSIAFLPNDTKYLSRFIAEQDGLGKNARLMGKSLDVVEEWVSRYRCDPSAVLDSKGEPKIYLPQPRST